MGMESLFIILTISGYGSFIELVHNDIISWLEFCVQTILYYLHYSDAGEWHPYKYKDFMGLPKPFCDKRGLIFSINYYNEGGMVWGVLVSDIEKHFGYLSIFNCNLDRFSIYISENMLGVKTVQFFGIPDKKLIVFKFWQFVY